MNCGINFDLKTVMKRNIKGVNFELAKFIYRSFQKQKTGFIPVMICLDYKFKLLIFVLYHFLLYYVIPFNYIGNTLNK